MLLATLTMVCGNLLAQDEATTVLWEASSGDALTTIYPDANISLKWEEGGGDSAPKYSNGSVLFYNGNRLTVAGVTTDVTIQKIVFTFSSGSASMVLCDKSGKNENKTGIVNNYSGMTSTWTGEANSLIFRAAKQTNNRYISSVEVTYTGGTTGPVEKKPVLNISNTTLGDTYDMDANGVFVVYAKNDGNAAAQNAKLSVLVDGAENTAWEIGTLAIGEEKWQNMKFDVTTIEAGSHTVKLALTADDAEAASVEKTVNFTKKAAEATFTVTAPAAINVEYGQESFDIVATVTNTSETVDATDVVITLWNNGAVDTKTIASLAHGAETQVTFTVTAPEGGFTPGRTVSYYVQAPKNQSQATVEVTFAEQPVEEVKSLEIAEINGTIKLGEESNSLRVTINNTGTVDITDATVVLTCGEATLGQGTVSATAGQQGWTMIAVEKTGLEAGTITVKAVVTVDAETTAEKTAEITVEAAPVPEATLVLTAADKEFTLGVDELNFTVNVKNTSEVDAENVNVNIIYRGIITIATKNIAKLAAGESVDLVFTAADVTIPGVDASMLPAGTYNLSAMTDGNKFGTSFTITVKEPEEKIVDIALVDIRGISEINLKETNTVQVWFTDNSTADELNASITLKMNGAEVGTETIAKGEQYKSFTLPTDALVAGETAELVATLTAENNKAENLALVSKTLNIVSGEVEPQAEIALNPISSWEVEAGEQEISVSVAVFNNGEADAENVKIELYKSYGDGLCEPQTIESLKAGESTFVTFKFNYTFEQGKSYEFTAFTNYSDADASNQMQQFTISCPAPKADVAVQKIADINATTEDEVVIAATVKNVSTVDAADVLVALYKGTEQVGESKKISELAAGAEANVEFSLGKLEIGTYNYTVMITSEDANADNNTQSVAVKVAEAVEQKVEVALTQIQGSQIDLAAASNTITVWVENTGTEAAEATISVTLNSTALEAQTVSVAAGKNGFAQFTLPTEGLVAGQKATVVATVAVEGNTAETVSLTKELDIIDSTVATEPAFEVSAADVEVELGAEKFDVVATVKNTTGIDAADVKVQLYYNGVIAEQTIATLNGNAEASVTFADVVNTFTKADVYAMSIMVNGKAVGTVNVIVKEAAVEPVFDLAITDIIGSIDLNNEQSTLSVAVENKGNQDMTAVEVKLTVAETEYTATIASLKAGDTGYAFFQVAAEGLTAGETTATATVEVAADATAADNTLTKTITVNAADVAQPTFSIAAADVTVPFGATTFNVVATVANTSDIDAQNVEVNFLNGITLVDKNIIVKLAAGVQKTVTFTVDAPEGGFEAGKTAKYYVQVGTQQAEVNVTFEAEPEAEVYDLAITSVSGSLSLDQETNQLYVYVENKGNQDATESNATVTLSFQSEKSGSVIESKPIAVAAGQSKLITFDIAADDLNVGDMEFNFEVAFIGTIEDANPEDNQFKKTCTIAAPAPELSFSVEDVAVLKNADSFIVKVNVANTGKTDAESVEVKVYDEGGALLGTETIATVAAGAEVTATVTVNKTYTEVGTFKNQLQVYVAGVEGVKWVGVTVTDDPLVVGIAAVKAQLGQNVKVYTLGGQKVNDVRKGQVYIINGKKVVVK